MSQRCVTFKLQKQKYIFISVKNAVCYFYLNQKVRENDLMDKYTDRHRQRSKNYLNSDKVSPLAEKITKPPQTKLGV